MSDEYIIRTVSYEEMKYPIDWAAAEGWNPGLYDLESFYHTDPNGYFLGLLNNQPIGCISAVSYGDFGFIGFYIVRPEYRGKGYGIKLWHKAIDYLSGKNIGLDGVVAQQKNYMKSGFKLAYQNIRYQGKGRGIKRDHSCLVDLNSVPFKKILEYDKELFPAARRKFLIRWFKQPESKCYGVWVNNSLKGFGMVRECREGYKIGPLFADSKKYAEELLGAFLDYVPSGVSVYFDVPSKNKAAVQLAKKYKMKKVFETARMYTKKEPKIALNKVFGVTTFELG